MARTESTEGEAKPRAKREPKPKRRKFYLMGPDFVRGGAPGFEFENVELLKGGRTTPSHVPWRPGFPDYPEPPRFLFDKKLGRPVRDL